jgi:hypothetical protein
MKKYLFIIIAMLFSKFIFCQNPCGSNFDLVTMQQLNPIEYANYLNHKNFITSYLANQASTNQRLINNDGIITIPVVVHVLHCGENIGVGRNISAAQIQSQIDVLNEDFRRLNLDKVNTPSAFASLASDFGIEFKLACINPAGGYTDGIVRVNTNITNYKVVPAPFTFQDEIATGIKVAGTGSLPWPTDKYLNIWVCDIKSTQNYPAAAYGTFPYLYPSRPQYDGVVVTYKKFGRINFGQIIVSTGRTATHEVRNASNLR